MMEMSFQACSRASSQTNKINKATWTVRRGFLMSWSQVGRLLYESLDVTSWPMKFQEDSWRSMVVCLVLLFDTHWCWAKLVTVGLSVWHTESKPLLLRDSTSDTKGRQLVKTVITLIQKTTTAPTLHSFSGATGRTCDSTISLLRVAFCCQVQKKADHQLTCETVTSFKTMPKTSDLNDVASLLCQEKLFHCHQCDLLSGGYFDIPKKKGPKGGIQKEEDNRKANGLAWPAVSQILIESPKFCFFQSF